VGGDAITIDAAQPRELAAAVNDRFACQAAVVGRQVRFETPDGPHMIPRLVETFGERIEAIRLGRPTLEDVFIARTGHRFWTDAEDDDGDD
jgi:ABC-2 type transport system ATP-binding protein